jgi:biopolymer transport protein ExbD
MSNLRTRRRHRPELPLVPLIDVLVMLVLFAFVTMRFSSNTTLNITLPKVDTAGKNSLDAKAIVIAVGKEGKMTFNGNEITDDQLVQLLEKFRGVDLNAKREIPVLISADEKSTLDKVTFIMDSCRKVGLSKISLQSRQ